MLENILTVIGLALFLVAAYFVGTLLNRFKHRRFIQAWWPLQPVIDGTVHEDPGGGGASSWPSRGTLALHSAGHGRQTAGS